MEYELYHYGRKGMKWYQNIFTKHKERVAARKKTKAEKEKVSVEERKKAIRESRSAEQVYKNAHLFNDKELNEIHARLDTENKIKNLIPKKVNKGKAFIENAASTTKNISSLVANTKDMIDKFKSFGKLFGGDKSGSQNSGNANTQKTKTDNNNNKSDKSKNNKAKAETAFDIIDKVSNTASSSKANKAADILNYDDFDATATAKALTNNIGSRTVNWAMNNPARIDSGASFVDKYLTQPKPNT